jgi:xanthine dehydrogenase accessory factor
LPDRRPPVGGEEVLARVARLGERGEPYALATVVRVLRPASTRPGDRALVTPDGTLEGWVGGACSEPIVVREALRALADGETRLVRICPPGGEADAPGDVVVAQSTCASEGTVEVLVEPHLPAPLLAVVGDAPAARALAALARTIGWRVADGPQPAADAVVVAAMGQGDEEGALHAALQGGAGYVGLVASARRAGVVAAALRARGLDERALRRLHSPAGLDLGPCTQEEIAVAILAELVGWRHARGSVVAPQAEAVDPVCGMTVPVAGAKHTTLHDGTRYWFCSAGCQASFTADPGRHLAGAKLST